jgi:polyhydroxyalkanoate synthesis regulator phasin
MSVTTDQYNLILARLNRIENVLNDTFVAMDKFVTLGQVNQLLTVVQQDIDDLRTRVASLEERVASIENEPLS